VTRSIVAILAASMIASSAYGAPEVESWKKVGGTALHELFAERELGDGVHYSYRFSGDGTFAGTEMAKDVRGKWRVSGREVCWTWIRPPGAEECYSVRKNGGEVSLFRNGVEQWYGTLKPLR
jgi:hypothetical protein